MRIVLSSLGTLGDLFPFLALGTALRDRGHSITMAAAPSLHHHVAAACLEPLPCRPDLGPEQVREAVAQFDHWPATGNEGASSPALSNGSEMVRVRVTDLLAACAGADMLVHNSGITGESVVCEILGIPNMRVTVAPERLWNPRQKAFLREMETAGPASGNADARDFFGWNQRCREEAGLPAAPASGWAGYFAPSTIVAASRHFLDAIDVSSWDATFCGFWFHEPPQWREWQPSPELAAFMERRPIVLSFSSQPVSGPARVVEIHVETARRLGRPILVQSGWAGFAGSDSDDVLFQGFLPQDWLFRRAACVIHHGGAGTTARALRNACPMLVEPWGNDQFFNAWMVVAGGWGAAANPKIAQPAALAALLEEKVLSPRTQDHVNLMARRINDENGVENVVRAIDKRLGIDARCAGYR